MKKILLFLTIFLIAFLINFAETEASSISLTPSSKNIEVGQTFQINIAVDPLGDKIFTTKVALSFPSDLLRVTTFTFNDKWIPLSQNGLNLINNETGEMVKTGGYPAPGLASQGLFGTVTFVVLKAGEAVISIGENSMTLNSESVNNLINKGNVVLSLKPATVTTKTQNKAVTEKPITKTSEGTTVPERFEAGDVKLPENVPSSDKAWLYTKLAVLSIMAFALQHYSVLIILALILIFCIIKILKKILS